MIEVFDNVNKIVSQWAFWTGLVSVMLFAVSRFNITLPDSDELSPPLKPRSFTTAFRFWLASSTYIVGYATLYFALLVLGSLPHIRLHLGEIFAPGGGAENPAIGTPAWAALIATAALPALPGVSGLDERVRAFLQDFASIPSKAHMLAADMLSALNVPEPKSLDAKSGLPTILAAIEAHRERFDQLKELWGKLQQLTAPGLFRRYHKFQTSNQKLLESFQHDLSANAAGITTVDAALYVERRSRDSMYKMGRFVACAMLQSESSESIVRKRLQEFDVKVKDAGLDFQLGHILQSFFFIALMTVIGSYVSVLIYYGVQRVIVGDSTIALLDLLHKGTPLFLGWILSTVPLYTLPITFAAGVAMYLLDRTGAHTAAGRQDKLTAAMLTFIGSAILALFVLLAYGVAGHLFDRGLRWTSLVPWIIPPSLVAATFVWLSTNPENLQLKRSETKLYMFAMGLVAAVGSVMAFGLWNLSDGKFDAKLAGGLPFGAFMYFVVIDAASIGAAIGWVLSGTSEAFRIGNPIRKT